MERNMVNGKYMDFLPSFRTYKDYSKEPKDVDALLDALVSTDNVPNDVFNHLRLLSVTRYYCPICVFAGKMLVSFSYEKQEGDKIAKISDTLQAGAFLCIPCHVQGALPEGIELKDEIAEEISLGDGDQKQFEDEAKAKGWKVEFPEGVDADTVIRQYEKQMLAMVKDFAMKILKEELGNVNKLRINNFEFRQNAPDDDVIPGSQLCKQPVSIIEYEYKGQTFKGIYKDGELNAVYPIDNDSKEFQGKFHKKMGICAIAAILMFVIQFTLLHSWPVTFLVLVGIGGYLFKLSRDLKRIQSEASGERSKVRGTIKAEDLLAAI
jgi:hypothetical protein